MKLSRLCAIQAASLCILIFCALGATAQETAPVETTASYKPYPVIFEAEQKAVLSAERAGVLTSLKYDVGAAVKKGAVVAGVDAGEPALMKKRNELRLGHLDTRVRELSRLNQQGLATNREVAEAQMDRDVTRSEIDIFNRQIGKSSIRAPFSGVVVRRHVQAHEWVTAGQPVMDLVNLDTIRAVGNVPAHTAVQLKKGTSHVFYVQDIDAEVSGTVTAVAPDVDERSNTAQVIWSIKKGDKNLLPGMKGEVRLDQ